MSAGDPHGGGHGPRPQDLKVRVASGVALAAVALALLYAGPGPFAALVLAVGLLMSWEWGRVVRSGGADTAFVVQALTIAAGGALAAAGYAPLGVIALVIGAIIVLALYFGGPAAMSALGVLYVGLPALALIWLRADVDFGFQAVLLLFLAVWASDTFAYAAGRALGGPKLWPRLSPHKTWSGLIGGIFAAACVAAAFAPFLPGASAAKLAVSGLCLGLVAQGGDLAESAFKRGFGVKDASTLIPGHGGFMDRVDGLVMAALAAAIVGLLVNVRAPGKALLFWS